MMWNPFGMFGGIFWLLALVAMIWVIVDVVKQRRMDNVEKVLWIVLAIFFSIITAIVYYFVKKR